MIVWEINQFIGKAAVFSFGDDLARGLILGQGLIPYSQVWWSRVGCWRYQTSDFGVRFLNSSNKLRSQNIHAYLLQKLLSTILLKYLLMAHTLIQWAEVGSFSTIILLFYNHHIMHQVTHIV